MTYNRENDLHLKENLTYHLEAAEYITVLFYHQRKEVVPKIQVLKYYL